MSTHGGRVSGTRAIIEFSPKLVSIERLCAGAVIRTDQGALSAHCAIDRRKAESAFGAAGIALHEVANRLCDSLLDHWKVTLDPSSWKPPFEGAIISRVGEFSAASVTSEARQIIDRHSTIGTLLSHYEIAEQQRTTNIVERVRSVVRRDTNAKHLAKRFNRELPLGADAGVMRVDFLGQHFACNFLQIVKSSRSSEVNTERALGKLYELQTLRKFVARPKRGLRLLEEERPHMFELVMVGNTSDPVQGRIARQVEAMADNRTVRARVLASATEAAEHVSTQERYAA